jgi:membrane associated rhomboid family serine protease
MPSPAVIALIAVNVAVYVLDLLQPRMFYAFELWPLQPIDGQANFHAWQIVTYGFLHDTGNIAHIAFNMVGLWMFGAQVEERVGAVRLLVCYFASIVTAALCQLWVPSVLHTEPAPTIGASGGVFGLLLAYALLFPHEKVVPLFLPVPMPAWLFATLFAGLELVLGVTGTQADVAHFAHIGGMLGSGMVVATWRGVERA